MDHIFVVKSKNSLPSPRSHFDFVFFFLKVYYILHIVIYCMLLCNIYCILSYTVNILLTLWHTPYQIYL